MKYESFGNIREHSLNYFWNESPAIHELRSFLGGEYRNIVGKCKTCDVLDDCKAGCIAQRLIQYRNLFKGPDPLCYRTCKKT